MQAPGCWAGYGPSGCEAGECVDDESYTECLELSAVQLSEATPVLAGWPDPFASSTYVRAVS